MLKSIIIFIVFILVIITIATIMTLFLAPNQVNRYNDCVLLKNIQTEQIDCFGCYNDVCKDAAVDWQTFDQSLNHPKYKCVQTTQGCEIETK